jgi:hypothetical protein
VPDNTMSLPEGSSVREFHAVVQGATSPNFHSSKNCLTGVDLRRLRKRFCVLPYFHRYWKGEVSCYSRHKKCTDPAPPIYGDFQDEKLF